MKRDTSSKHLSMPETICVVRECLDSIPQPVVARGATWSEQSVVGTCGVQLEDTVVAEVRRIVSLERENRAGP